MTLTKKWQLIEDLRIITNDYINDKHEGKNTDWIIERLRKIIKDYELRDYISEIIFIRYARKQLDWLHDFILDYNKSKQQELHRKIDEFLAWFTSHL